MKKKQLGLLVLSLATIAVIGVGSTLAYFTDTSVENNVIVMGKVDIDLEEPQFDEENPDKTIEGVLPNQVIVKDPTITIVDGSADCYIRTKIEMNDVLNETQKAELLAELNIDTNSWYMAEDGYYYYNQILSTKEDGLKKVVFFDKVTIPEHWGNETVGLEIHLEVSAEAIQSEHFVPQTEDDMITGWFNSKGEAITAETYVEAQ